MIRSGPSLDERHMRAPFFILVASLAVSGCTALADLDRTLSARLNPAPPAPYVAAPAVPLPDRKPAAPRQTVVRTAPVKVQATPPKPERPPGEEAPVQQAARPAVPETLVGLSADDLRAVMGSPAQEIAEAPGVRWRYRGAGCVLDIHLFPRVESQGLYALDVSATGLSAEQCLDTFRAPPPKDAAVAAPQALVPSAAGATPTVQ